MLPRLRSVLALMLPSAREEVGLHAYDGAVQDLSPAGVRAGLAAVEVGVERPVQTLGERDVSVPVEHERDAVALDEAVGEKPRTNAVDHMIGRWRVGHEALEPVKGTVCRSHGRSPVHMCERSAYHPSCRWQSDYAYQPAFCARTPMLCL
jgi:hypothetical protein